MTHHLHFRQINATFLTVKCQLEIWTALKKFLNILDDYSYQRNVVNEACHIRHARNLCLVQKSRSPNYGPGKNVVFFRRRFRELKSTLSISKIKFWEHSWVLKAIMNFFRSWNRMPVLNGDFIESSVISTQTQFAFLLRNNRLKESEGDFLIWQWYLVFQSCNIDSRSKIGKRRCKTWFVTG